MQAGYKSSRSVVIALEGPSHSKAEVFVRSVTIGERFVYVVNGTGECLVKLAREWLGAARLPDCLWAFGSHASVSMGK
jgi:hypothetical protein